MLNSLRQEITQKLALVRPLSAEEQQAMIAQFMAQQEAARAAAEAPAVSAVAAAAAAAAGPRLVAGTDNGARRDGFNEADPATWGNPSRNDPCPCGSGERFKNCHGKLV